MKKNEYRCDECGEIFGKGQSDEEAKEEQAKNGWADMPEDCMAIVCDDCYQKIMGQIN